MASQAFPPTPAQPKPPQANPVGQAVSQGQPNMQAIVKQAGEGLKALSMLAKILGQSKPEAGAKINEGIASIQQAIQMLKGGGQPGPTAPQGSVPPPPQMAEESPAAETPEAT